MKKSLIFICLSVILTQGSFKLLSPNGFIEDKGNGMRIMYYEMKVGTVQVKQNDKDMKTSIVKNGDKIMIVLTGVDGFIPKDGANVFPAAEVTVTDENNNVLYESENILAKTVGTRGVSIAEAKFLESDFTISAKWPTGIYKWEVKFWDLNGPGVILSDMKITKK
jgi:hypothetical protein